MPAARLLILVERSLSASRIQIQVGDHVITAADPIPDDLRQALDHIHGRAGASNELVRDRTSGT